MKLLILLLKVLLIILVVFAIIYLLGPKVEKPVLDKTLPDLPTDLIQLEQSIQSKESTFSNIKEDNEARIIWADSIPTKTTYSVVYLHGWSASQEEGDPIHTIIAERYGFNLFLPRLAGHGLIEEEPMCDLTADQLFDSAKEAIAIGKNLGEKVIVMGTSTGGTLALALSGGDNDIAALMLYSPNVALFSSASTLLSGPWGVKLAKILIGEYIDYQPESDLNRQYWTNRYCSKALPQLQVLVDQTMKKKTFEVISQPVFMGYYYKDNENQDKTVSVPAMLKMFDQLGTSIDQKRKVAFPEAGEHVITSHITSKDLESVKTQSFKFLDEVLGIEKK